MVRLWSKLSGLLLGALLLTSTKAWALLPMTASDLEVLEDALRHAIETDASFKGRVTPLLLATPVHHWRESRADFKEAASNLLKTVFGDPNAVIYCPDCDAWRLNVQDGGRLVINNGELSLAELGRIKQDARYGAAKAFATVRETPAGVELRIVDLADGRIVFHSLADSSKKLDAVKPWMNYAAERERRLSGESLTYVFINMGLYPNGLFQLEYLEQWGDRNQHISGVGLSLLNPNFALGGVYHYMIPRMRKLHVSGAVYLPLQNVFQDATEDSDNPASKFVAQGMIQYAFANSYAVFAGISTEGLFSMGVSLYNPLFLPFLL